MSRTNIIDGDSYRAFPEADRPLLINGGEFAPEGEEIIETTRVDSAGDEWSSSYWRRCPGTVADIDPEWSTDKVVAWNMHANCELDNHAAWFNVDDGIRPFLYDLNRNGMTTGESNIWCTGSYEMGGPPRFYFTTHLPDSVVDNIETYLPDGYSADLDRSTLENTETSSLSVVPDKCIQEEDYPDPQCMRHIPGEEVQQVDQAFVRGLRESIDT